MIRKFLLLLCISVFLFNCDDSCDQEVDLTVDEAQLAVDLAGIEEYLQQNNITAQEHPSGLRYVIDTEGDGRTADLCDDVSVSYEGFLMSNGERFDGTASIVTFGLTNLIPGWQIGIPLVREGGRITLYIPSVYGYGEEGAGTIPPNSNLIFTIYVANASS